jgi:hypothetical protein
VTHDEAAQRPVPAAQGESSGAGIAEFVQRAQHALQVDLAGGLARRIG